MRKFIKLEKANSNSNVINVVQFNMLAHYLANPMYFPYCKKKFLEKKFRQKLMMKNMKNLVTNNANPVDVICIQECDNYWSFLKKEFEKLGYDSVYCKRPSNNENPVSEKSFSIGRKSLTKLDGIAIFYKSEVLELENEPFIINHSDGHYRISMISEFNHVKSKKKIVVFSTHIYWNHEKVDDQLNELKEIEYAIAGLYLRNKDSKSTPCFILCADLNSTPNSRLITYLKDKFLRDYNLNFKSAYPLGSDDEKEKYTSVTHTRCRTIDYIWYSSENFTLNSILEIPKKGELIRKMDAPEEWIKENKNDETKYGIPNSIYSSDHLPIQAILSFK